MAKEFYTIDLDLERNNQNEYNLTSNGSSDMVSSDAGSLLENEFKPILYEDLIDDVCILLKTALSKNRYSECMRFIVEKSDSSEEIKKIDDSLDCSSEASSALVSLTDLNFEDATKFVLAVKKSESRKSTASHCITEISVIIPITEKHEPPPIKDKTLEVYSLPVIGIKSSIKSENGSKYSQFEKIPEAKHSIEPFFKFNLPTNLELLKDMDILSYLEKYCWICDARLAYYQKQYSKCREHRDNSLSLSKLYQLINDIFANTFNERQYNLLCKILELEENSTIQQKHIFQICAVAERMFFKLNLSQDSGSAFEISKSFQEKIDFANIIEKLQKYETKQSLEILFRIL